MGCTSNRQSVHQIGALERKNRADAEQKNALYSGYDDVHDFLPLLQHQQPAARVFFTVGTFI
jgi:hypothetical protein